MSWNPLGHSRLVTGLLYIYLYIYIYSPSLVVGEGRGEITTSFHTMPMHTLVYLNQNTDKEFSAALVSE
jgi:hypothetical protein